MSFWAQSDGTSAVSNDTEFDGGGGFELIPDKSTVLATITEAKWQERDGAEYINLKWEVAKPESIAGSVVYQKIYATDDKPNAKDPKKAKDSALRMLSAIDANAGGKLGRKAARPSDEDLAMALVGKPMCVKVMVWEMEIDGQPKSGNWISAIFPKTAEVKLGDSPAPKRQASSGGSSSTGSTGNGGAGWGDDDLGDEIPFD